MHFIPDARIKSRIFYWINTIDDRFGDIVLLVKEWAKAQNINDPKNGTLNSYSLCLLVLFHFQTCEPAILPPLKEIYDGNVAEDIAGMAFRDEKHVDEVCVTNKARFLRQNMGQRNQSSVSQLLASFFHKIEDSFERPDNAARAVGAEELLLIGRAFKYVSSRFTAGALADRNELVSLLCTPTVQSILGDRVRASRYTMDTPNQQHQQARSLTGSRSAITSQMFAGRQTAQPSTEHVTAGLYQNNNRSHVYASDVEHQYHDDLRLYAARRQQASQYQNQHRRREFSPYQSASTTRYDEPVGRRYHNGPTWDYGS
ncbi:hypothetical protein PR202_ga09064 [Eleusine coracana subsp. coracana]|uniref:Uncharacterized protein n=1 Tax=Eleusine coracana subsp. coracana TaxID=191504 RepID=A0AAV5C4A1_ELECO|nr:hypothetical protein PR202_ga09064 [Eleusine coracana subsp. coracana]